MYGAYCTVAWEFDASQLAVIHDPRPARSPARALKRTHERAPGMGARAPGPEVKIGRFWAWSRSSRRCILPVKRLRRFAAELGLPLHAPAGREVPAGAAMINSA